MTDTKGGDGMKVRFLLLSSVAAVSLTGPVFAQFTEAPAASQTQSSSTDEADQIIVTATRRKERL